MIVIISFGINGTLEMTSIVAIFAAVDPAALWERPSTEIANILLVSIIFVIWGQ